MVEAKVDGMIRKVLVLFMGGAALAGWAGDGGSAEAQRVRAGALEALVAAKQAYIQSTWRELSQVDGQLAQLRDDAPDAEQRTPERARELLAVAERRQLLEARRLQLLRDLAGAYGELAATRLLLSENKAQMRRAQQVLDGHWAIGLMPSGLKGDFFLDQNGTLVAGEYRLENGQTGNLQGTFISGHLLLERIDSQYGKIGRYEAALGKDPNALKGTWYSYDLTSGQPLTGAFTMDRVAEEEGSP